MKFLNKLSDDEILSLAQKCGLPKNLPSTEAPKNKMVVLRFDRQVTIISKNEGFGGARACECSMLSINDYEVLKSAIAGKGNGISTNQNATLATFLRAKFGKEYVNCATKYWEQKRILKQAQEELEMM